MARIPFQKPKHIEWEISTDRYGRLVAEPFEKGYALTVGNSLRRTLLSIIPGAAVATSGIFLPSFIFVLIVGRFIPKLRNSPLASGFLDGVNAASLGLMLTVTIKDNAVSLAMERMNALINSSKRKTNIRTSRIKAKKRE